MKTIKRHEVQRYGPKLAKLILIEIARFYFPSWKWHLELQVTRYIKCISQKVHGTQNIPFVQNDLFQLLGHHSFPWTTLPNLQLTTITAKFLQTTRREDSSAQGWCRVGEENSILPHELRKWVPLSGSFFFPLWKEKTLPSTFCYSTPHSVSVHRHAWKYWNTVGIKC